MAIFNGSKALVYAAGADGVMKPIAGQKGASLEIESEMIDVNHKGLEWTAQIAGRKSWSLSCETLLMLDDEGFKLIESAFMDGTELQVEIQTEVGKKFKGAVLCESLSYEFGEEEAATFSAEFVGNGALEKVEAA